MEDEMGKKLTTKRKQINPKANTEEKKKKAKSTTITVEADFTGCGEKEQTKKDEKTKKVGEPKKTSGVRTKGELKELPDKIEESAKRTVEMELKKNLFVLRSDLITMVKENYETLAAKQSKEIEENTEKIVNKIFEAIDLISQDTYVNEKGEIVVRNLLSDKQQMKPDTERDQSVETEDNDGKTRDEQSGHGENQNWSDNLDKIDVIEEENDIERVEETKRKLMEGNYENDGKKKEVSPRVSLTRIDHGNEVQNKQLQGQQEMIRENERLQREQEKMREELKRLRKEKEKDETTNVTQQKGREDDDNTEEEQKWQPPKFTYMGNKLSKTTDFGMWLRRVKSHIVSRGVGWCIGIRPEGNAPKAPHRQDQTRAAVCEFIQRHLDDEIYRLVPSKITDQGNPIALLDYLELTILPPGKVQLVAYRQELGQLRFDIKRDDTVAFQTSFNGLCERMRKCPGVKEEDFNFGLIMAIKGAFPTIYERWANQKEEMPVEEIFSRMRTEELHRQDEKRRMSDGTKAAKEDRAYIAKRGDSDGCHGCGELGHWRRECPHREPKCFRCNEYGHLAKDCTTLVAPRLDRSRSRDRQSRQRRRGESVERGKDRGSKWQSRDSRTSSRTIRRGRSPGFKPKYALMRRRDVSRENAKRRKAGSKEMSMFMDAKSANKKYDDQYIWVDREQYEEESDKEEARYAEDKDDKALRTFDGESQLGLPFLYMIADSGASRHISKSKESFVNLRKLKTVKRISCANGDKEADLLVNYEGDVVIRNNGRIGIIRNVLYAPNLSVNLFSIVKIVETMNVTFTKNGVYLRDAFTEELVKSGTFNGSCWELRFELPLVGASKEEREKIIREVYQSEDSGGSRKRGERALTSGDAPLKEVGGRKRKRVSFSEDVVDIDEICAKNKMNKSDLDHIDEKKVKSLRDNVGMLWHLRLNHASYEYLKMATKVIPEMKNVSVPKEVMDCEDCILAKARKKPCTGERRQVTEPFERVHTDLIGKITPMAFRSKEQYIVTFTDEVSRYAFSFSMQTKMEVHEALEDCLQEARRVKGNQYLKMHILKSDGGTEYKTAEIKEVYEKEKITRETSLPCVHQHNGKAERINLQIQRDVRVNLISAGMPAGYWKYALKHAINVYNRQPHSALNFRTPYEVFTGYPSKVKYIRRFGCAAYVLDENIQRGEKFKKRSVPGFLLNCDEDGYTVLLRDSKSVVRSKDVDFIETKVYGDVIKEDDTKEINFGEERIEMPDCKECEKGILTRNQARKLELLENEKRERNEEDKEKVVDKMNEELEKEIPEPKYNNGNSHEETLERKARLKETWIKAFDQNDEVEKYENKEVDEDEANIAFFIENLRLNDEPANVKEALESKECQQWDRAMKEEFDSLERCGTWKLINRVDGPKNPSVVDTKWVFKKKNEMNGTKKYKGRCVARGFKDKNSYDVDEVYAPVARLSDVRFVASSANSKDLELRQYDVKTAFLNGALDRPIYMVPPDGLYERERKRGNLRGVTKEDFKRGYLCELKRSIYGLRVSPKNWYTRFSATMKRLRFAMYPMQSSLFLWREKESIAILLVYVDDILLASNDPTKMEEVEKELTKEYELSNTGEPKMFLGIEIERDRKRGILRMTQKSFIDRILKRFNLDHAKEVIRTPMASHDQRRRMRESEAKMTDKEVKSFPFRQIIGSLLYLQGGTRPDITYAVNVLSRKQSNFDAHDCVEVKRILRYLKATRDLGIEFRRGDNKEERGITCYVDASLGSNDEEGHSTSGYAIFLNSDLIIWRTKRQNHVALSSAEAEYVAMSLACRDVIGLREMCKRILKEKYLPVLKEDSKPARELALTEESKTLKHIVKLCYHYVRELARDKKIRIDWTPTKSQIADFFTKPLEASKFYEFRKELVAKM